MGTVNGKRVALPNRPHRRAYFVTEPIIAQSVALQVLFHINGVEYTVLPANSNQSTPPPPATAGRRFGGRRGAVALEFTAVVRRCHGGHEHYLIDKAVDILYTCCVVSAGKVAFAITHYLS